MHQPAASSILIYSTDLQPPSFHACMKNKNKEHMKMEILNSSTRKYCRKLTRCPRIISSQADEDKGDIKSNSCHNNENGEDESMVLRVKLVLSRGQVRQLVSVLGLGGRSNGAKITPELVEKIQHVVSRKKHVKFKVESDENVKWKPQLQSIPEEI